MKIKQFKDAPLAHYSYAIVSNGEMGLIDPSRNPMQYYKYAEEQNARITAVLETHPHADFVSGHLQIHEETGATIYVSEKVGVSYPHEAFDEGQEINIGNVVLKPLHTPGHSPDSLSFVATERDESVLFTGDTIFIGNVGRPDLRENVGNMRGKRVELAKAMYNTVKTKFHGFSDDTLIYPAHGAGSLCGKNMSDAASSTLGAERETNWAFRDQTEEEFVNEILKDQPFIPAYFGFNVDTNRTGAVNVKRAKAGVNVRISATKIPGNATVIDCRDEKAFKAAHLPNSINIMSRGEADKFETWLGSIVKPGEPFSLVVESVQDFDNILERVAKIGYEKQLEWIVTLSPEVSGRSPELDLEDFRNNKVQFTIVDIRNEPEVAEGKIFDDAIFIPLHQLRERVAEIPMDKPVVVHCAGGYRSAAGSSIIQNSFPDLQVYDLSDHIKEFK